MTQVTGNVTATHLTYIYGLIPNGDFETGDFTSWSTSVYNTGTATITTDESATSYGSVAQFSAYGGTDLIALTQTGIDTSDANNISIDYKILTASDDISFGIQINPGIDVDGWQLIAIDCSATTDWTNLITALQTPSTSATVSLIMSGGVSSAYLDNVKIDSILTSATIEDSSKTWTADQFNTDGMFILTSGDVKGYSCTILDTFENYIQVPTTYANIINNIRVYETGYGNYEDFETGATTWTKDDELNIDFESTGPGGETPSPHSGTYCCKISQGPE
jgi:hypothetical protein